MHSGNFIYDRFKRRHAKQPANLFSIDAIGDMYDIYDFFKTKTQNHRINKPKTYFKFLFQV